MIGGLADIQLSSPRAQNEPTTTHALLGYCCVGVLYTEFALTLSVTRFRISIFQLGVPSWPRVNQLVCANSSRLRCAIYSHDTAKFSASLAGMPMEAQA